MGIWHTSLSFWFFAMLSGFWEHCLNQEYVKILDANTSRKRNLFKHTSNMAACTLEFWKAMATSGLAIILDITSSGASPICSAINIKWI